MPDAATLDLPALPYDDWEDTKATIHLVAQILGKVKLAHHPKQNHWWHITLHVTPRGISTHTIPTPTGSFELTIDVHDHELVLETSAGRRDKLSLPGKSVAEIYQGTMAMLSEAGYPTEILAKPYDMPHSDIPFAEDQEHRSWDRDAVHRFWHILLFIDGVFKTFAGRSFAKTTPVHLFWHSFDFVVTRFTGRQVPNAGEAGRRSDAEAYSHEVISFGFWPGDPKVRFPAFYSYTAPEPKGIEQHALQPEAAWWEDLGSSHMALLKWDDVRTAKDPAGALMDFLETTFTAGCTRAQWKDIHEQDTTPMWDQLDERFPRTAGRERR